MEELQDAIEDLQYMDAMHDTTPKPTKHMTLLKPKELKAFMDQLSTEDLSLEKVCRDYTGFYLFKKFLETTSHNDADAKIYIEYAIDLAVFRTSTMASRRRELAVTIAESYLMTISEEHKSSHRGSSVESDKPRWSHTMCRVPPSLKGSQLKRVPDTMPRPVEGEREKNNNASRVSPVDGESYIVSDETTDTRVHWESYMDLVGSRSALKIIGAPLNKVLEAIKSEEADVESDLFDEIDAIAFEYIRHQYFSDFCKSNQWQRYFQLQAMCKQRLVESDFSLYRVLGRGGFGLVNACKHGYTGKLYAMKMLNKKRVKMKKAEKLCLNERNIMASVESLFIVCLRYAFSTPSDLYLVLDIMTGGDLGYHLSRVGAFTLKESRYYAARIVLGIAALHEMNIVYRDLKPDNILMDSEGFTKISDLGLATAVSANGTYGCCGTRGYWAPEMVRKNEQGKRERYGLAVDWFSLGCVVYEFLFGISPFRTDTGRSWGFVGASIKDRTKAEKDASVDKAILEMEPEWPEYADAGAVSLLEGLLEKNPSDRLGAGRNGAEAIKAHPFFAEIDWGAINSIPPPIKPSMEINMASQSDIGFFADEAEYKKVALSEEDHAVYKDWDFVSMNNYQMELVEFMMVEEVEGRIRVDDGTGGCCALA